MYVCVYIYIYTYIYMYTHMCIYVYICIIEIARWIDGGPRSGGGERCVRTGGRARAVGACLDKHINYDINSNVL